MPAEARRQVTDVRALHALANPIRYRLLGHLMALGTQTASECAAAVGATPSNCSYHLRELERYGLVERAPDARGADGRDRPWRPVATGLSYGRTADEGATPVEAALKRQLLHAAIDHDAELAHRAADAHDDQPADWRAAETMAEYGLLVTPAELRTITAAIDAIVRPWIGLTRADVPDGGRPVHVQLAAFLRPIGSAGRDG
ncbi:MAG TPA: helix-turn-helix domain-containing protein [Candidatus Limnocylindrales bacterium]|jgi:DNA-binding transcriptional ArsR family regulator